MQVPGNLVGGRRSPDRIQAGALAAAFSLSFLVPAPVAAQSSSAQASSASFGTPPVRVAAEDITEDQAVRFLIQSTFGAIPCDAARLQVVGFPAWFDEQEAETMSLARPWLEWLAGQGKTVNQETRRTAWWYFNLVEEDQLRQRIAWALSQILVVSEQDPMLAAAVYRLADYYDQLVLHAFGNYRDLLEVVAKHPAMGAYLGMLKNSAASGGQADENFARELMQMFTIGMVELAPDGTPVLDAGGAQIPTYTQTEVEELARALTGWNYAGATDWNTTVPNYLPMEAWPAHHDAGQKVIIGGVVLPAGQTAEQDLDQVLDTLFQHPNAGPFLARKLIQRFVTSNPSPGYVARVAAVFADNGAGVRGDLGAVIRVILTDYEAQNGHLLSPATFGKLKEPILRHTHVWRLFRAIFPPGGYVVPDLFLTYGQAPLGAQTVGGFYSPSFAPAGAISNQSLVAPEFQVSGHGHQAATTNRFYELIFEGYEGYPLLPGWQSAIQLEAVLPLAGDPAALVDWLDRYLLAGRMSSAMRSVVEGLVADTPLDDGTGRVLEALYLVVTSPEFAVQK